MIVVMKLCPKCRQTLPADKFWKHKNRPDGLQVYCKTCSNMRNTTDSRREYIKKYDAENADKVKEWHKKSLAKYRASEHGKQKRAEYNASQTYKEIARKYRLSDKGKQSCRVRHSRRRSALAGIPAKLSLDDWRTILEMYNYRCAYCGSDDVLTQDHIIPISKGGTTDIDNIVPACGKCNSSKRDNDLIIWLSRTESAGVKYVMYV